MERLLSTAARRHCSSIRQRTSMALHEADIWGQLTFADGDLVDQAFGFLEEMRKPQPTRGNSNVDFKGLGCLWAF